MNLEIDKTLSEYIQSVNIIRKDNIAEVVVDYFKSKPIRLIGFETTSTKTDFEIYEESYNYYNELKYNISLTKI